MSYSKPLEGIKIVEISTIVTASLATMMMADQGAEVIKIEQSGIGDPMRYLGTQKGGVSALFANCNRGKKSIDLNLNPIIIGIILILIVGNGNYKVFEKFLIFLVSI